MRRHEKALCTNGCIWPSSLVTCTVNLLVLLMTEEQLDLLRHLIKQEIDAASIDGMEHGAWGWADKQLEEGWKCFKDSFKST
jgi:hypothetical protein